MLKKVLNFLCSVVLVFRAEIKQMSFRFVPAKALAEFRKTYGSQRRRKGYPKVEGIVDGLWFKIHGENVCGCMEIFRI